MNDMYTQIDKHCEQMDLHSLNHAYGWLVEQEADAKDAIKDANEAEAYEFEAQMEKYLEKIQALLARVEAARAPELEADYLEEMGE